MKKVIIFSFILFLLSSCWRPDNAFQKDESKKNKFFIETKKIDELPREFSIKKTWKLASVQDIKLNSNASWRVSSILFKAWDKVKIGQPIILLEDNIWNYAINLAKAKNSLEAAKINYDSSNINFLKQIFDSEINLEKLNKNLEALKKESKQTIKKAKDDLENSKYSSLDSKSALELEKIDNNIEKQKLDYDNKLISDMETIDWFKASLRKDYNSLFILLDDIIEFSDKLLWVTKENKDENDSIEDYLWWDNRKQKVISEDSLKELISYRKSSEFTVLWEKLKQGSLWEDEISSSLDTIDSWYEKSKVLLNNLEETLNNSIESVWLLWPADIASYTATLNSYQSTLQINSSSFIPFSNSTISFLRTYKNSQESLIKQIELLKKDRDILKKSLSSSELWAEVSLEKTVISTTDAINNLETQLKIAENNLENAKKTRDIGLRSLNNSISQAEISYRQASLEYSKLTIKSPINWTISDVLVDIWQEVWIWIQVLNIVWDNAPEVELSFKKDELSFIKEGQKVFLNYDNKTLTWSIYSLLSVADNNLNYKSKIVFNDKLPLIWDLVVVSIPLELEKPLLPINAVETNWNWSWFLNVFKDNKVIKKEVELGNVYGDKIELNTIVSDDIIINDISNFDENNFELILKN